MNMKKIAIRNVESPERGAPVWLRINGEPAMRYFVEFYSRGVRLAFDPELSQVVYHEFDAAHLYARKSDVLARMCDGLEHRLTVTQGELAARRRQLAECVDV